VSTKNLEMTNVQIASGKYVFSAKVRKRFSEMETIASNEFNNPPPTKRCLFHFYGPRGQRSKARSLHQLQNRAPQSFLPFGQKSIIFTLDLRHLTNEEWEGQNFEILKIRFSPTKDLL